MRQQARNVKMWLEDAGLDIRFLIHDQDNKFTEEFDEWFRQLGRVIRTPFQTPVANSFAESWIGTLKRECLNHFACFSLRHLDYIIQTYVCFYNDHRPHQSLGNLPLDQSEPPEELPPPDTVGCIQHLGGLLNHYYRKAV